jgi:hypothetical protein
VGDDTAVPCGVGRRGTAEEEVASGEIEAAAGEEGGGGRVRVAIGLGAVGYIGGACLLKTCCGQTQI